MIKHLIQNLAHARRARRARLQRRCVVAGDAGPGRSMARCSIGPRVPLSLAAPTVRGYVMRCKKPMT
jgi:hypothetical protein